MKWIENLESIALKNKASECPICKGKNLDYGFTVVVEETNMGHGTVWCNDCHNGYHLSRVKVEDGMKIQDIPTNINFKN